MANEASMPIDKKVHGGGIGFSFPAPIRGGVRACFSFLSLVYPHTKVLRRDFLDRGYAGFDDQPAVARHFIAPASEQFAGTDSVMTQKAVDAVRVFVAWAVVMKRQCAAQITSEEERRR